MSLFGSLGSFFSGGLSSIIGSILAGNSAKSQFGYQTALNKQSYKYTKKLQDQAQAFNEAMQDKANAFNQDMFNQSAQLSAQAHQIEVADMKKAGLNPILSATGGNGANVVGPMSSATASSGSGSVSGGSAPLVDKSTFISNMISAHNQTRNTNSAIDLNKSTQKVNESQDRLNMYNGDKAHEESAFTNEQNRQYQIWNPLIQKAQLDNIVSSTAKNYQDMANSVSALKSQIQLNNASAKDILSRVGKYSKQTGMNINIPMLGKLGFESFK